MQPEDRRANFVDGAAAQHTRRSGTYAAAHRGRLGQRSPVSPDSNPRQEYRRWADAMLQDHELLRQLLNRFECALDSRERASLFHLAVEFHEAHRRCEHAWEPALELDPEQLKLEQMTALIQHLKPEGPAWNGMARAWGARLRTLMNKEDQLYRGKREQVQQFAAGWPRNLLECRLSLISEIRKALRG